MNHNVTTVERVREHAYVARCECGHEAEGPNPDTARKRHDIHAWIQHNRDLLDQAGL